MEVLLEASYIVSDEPELFSTLEQQTRVVYVWSDKRAHLHEENYTVLKRASELTEEPKNACIEIWVPCEQTDPPANIDDTWSETFKKTELGKVSLEWHPQEHLIRLQWPQVLSSLQKQQPAASVLKKLGLLLPPLPTLLL